MKVKRNLGSIILNVTKFSQDGYTVKYSQGDICDAQSEERYSSEVKYICNN